MWISTSTSSGFRDAHSLASNVARSRSRSSVSTGGSVGSWSSSTPDASMTSAVPAGP
ncbi:hypothetical protein WDV94_08365 [Clavibacter tessellarius]